jgi:hypothetical protein
VFLFSSCNVLDPKVDVPSYITIDKIDVEVSDPVTFGSSSHNITDAWVIFDDQIQGVYELPATFPVLKSGDHNIRIRPGIKINGIASTRAFYVYYSSFNQTINLSPGKETIVQPIVDYDPSTTVSFFEDFEDGGVKFELASNSEGSLFKTNNANDVLDGNFSGVIKLTDTESFSRISSLNTAPLDLPRGGISIFLEVDYKNNHKFTAGLVGVYSDGNRIFAPALTVNPRTDWNKIYINLTSVINTSVPDAAYYLLYFQVNREDISTEINVFLDNIKVIR